LLKEIDLGRNLLIEGKEGSSFIDSIARIFARDEMSVSDGLFSVTKQMVSPSNYSNELITK